MTSGNYDPNAYGQQPQGYGPPGGYGQPGQGQPGQYGQPGWYPHLPRSAARPADWAPVSVPASSTA
jgi:hypothetical protein